MAQWPNVPTAVYLHYLTASSLCGMFSYFGLLNQTSFLVFIARCDELRRDQQRPFGYDPSQFRPAKPLNIRNQHTNISLARKIPKLRLSKPKSKRFGSPSGDLRPYRGRVCHVSLVPTQQHGI